jgi:hypothetical protein
MKVTGVEGLNMFSIELGFELMFGFSILPANYDKQYVPFRQC